MVLGLLRCRGLAEEADGEATRADSGAWRAEGGGIGDSEHGTRAPLQPLSGMHAAGALLTGPMVQPRASGVGPLERCGSLEQCGLWSGGWAAWAAASCELRACWPCCSTAPFGQWLLEDIHGVRGTPLAGKQHGGAVDQGLDALQQRGELWRALLNTYACTGVGVGGWGVRVGGCEGCGA